MNRQLYTKGERTSPGFSFIEIAIFLIVIGLIAGGWLGFNYIQKASKIRNVIAELGQFYTATQSFKEAYQYLPGDIPNATSYWFNDTECPGPHCCIGVAWKSGDCNGSGNQQVSWANGPDSNESLRAWQHLVLAGFLRGNYDGTGMEGLPGSNIPASKSSDVTYDFHYGAVGGNEERNYLGVGSYNKGGAPQKAALTPSEAYNIDVKIDDGYPLKGNFLSSDGLGKDACTKGFVAASSTYDATEGTLQCISHRNIDKQLSVE